MSYILSQVPIGNTASEMALKKRRQLAKSILKMPLAQKIVLETFVKLSPLVWSEVSRVCIPDAEYPDVLPPLKKDEELIFGVGPVEGLDLLQKNFEEVQKEIRKIKKMFSDYNKEALEDPLTVSQYDINKAIERADEDVGVSDNLVRLLTDLESYDPPFILDIRDISHDVWEEHHAQETKIDEARQKKDMQEVRFSSEIAQREEWIRERSGLKINRLEKKIEEIWDDLGKQLERKTAQMEDLMGKAFEEQLREDEILGEKETEVIDDLPTALQKIQNMTVARSVLEKKNASHEKTIKGLNYKLEMLNKSSKEQSQAISTLKSLNDRFKSLVISLIDQTSFLDEYKTSAKASVKEEKLSKLEDMLKNNKYEVTKSENAMRKITEIKRKFTQAMKESDGKVKATLDNLLKSLNLDDPEFNVEDTPKAKSPKMKQKSIKPRKSDSHIAPLC